MPSPVPAAERVQIHTAGFPGEIGRDRGLPTHRYGDRCLLQRAQLTLAAGSAINSQGIGFLTIESGTRSVWPGEAQCQFRLFQ